MKIKKYVAPSMRDALEKMKRDLGTGAVILGSRKISRGGLLDFLGREMFEVTATTEENVLLDRKKAPAGGGPNGSRISVTIGDDGPVTRPAAADFSSVIKSTLEQSGTPAPTAGAGGLSSGGSSNVHLLRQELKELKSAVGEMAEQIKYQKMPALPAMLKEIYKKLSGIELEERTAVELVQNLYGRYSEKEYGNRELVEKFLIDEISRMIRVVKPSPVREKAPLKIVFLGPSGVGKTTCLAKLATSKKFYGDRRVAMITADTYRVAATQQLGTFSEIADIPMEIVHSPRDLTRALKHHQDKEVILIDTAGGSQYNDKLISELKELLEAADPDEVQLVLSVNTKPKDMQHMIKRFKISQSTRLLLTKFDETLTFGSIVAVVRDSGVPLSYLTFGQEVPEDIELADPLKIARLVVNNVF
ncbi:MAG: flagellar biosynthesis protein FlhF [Candidatus Glassbacteria bacterium RIFCSPLOWO2_12_FULL_58_11]|uniref:Flagellar biosynthesis protein FlhF n=1 Tax=Candidatus Glassbacteria bacterium RIFCSPLOWO2_12_FULL_58_11 TaxID=1817867 RepID=A0A1F5YL97_9BACT|nr:MAG: flagellar biosynthesis protein FlhF [Candidatus Glassbacteria bacterium RIFCSPLOWO2_12_FULL_58_11]